jgi:DNA-binding Lrp family transcriptional regulator
MTALDDIDRQLLAILRHDARRTVTSLGEEVALSPPAVRRRLDRLEREGVIRRYTVDIAADALGWGVEAFVDVQFEARTTTAEIAAWVSRHPEVEGAWTVTGEADAHIRVRAADQRHLEEFLNRLRRDAGVLRSQTVVVLSRLDAPQPGP